MTGFRILESGVCGASELFGPLIHQRTAGDRKGQLGSRGMCPCELAYIKLAVEGPRMFGWFRRHVRKVEVLDIGVEFYPPPDPLTGTPVPAVPTLPNATTPPVAIVQGRQRVTWQELLEILQKRVGMGQITTYGECSQWAFGSRKGGQSIRSMLEAAASRGYQIWTNRVVSGEGLCGAADAAYGQSAQLRAEGVPFAGDVVDLARCPPVIL